MAQYKPWLKMWVEWLHDPKMLKLTLAEAGAWWKLVTLARECGDDGRLVNGHGAPLDLKDIMATCHITSSAACKAFHAMLKKMESDKSLKWDGTTLVIINFKKRQEKTASETPEAVRDRVAKWRREHKVVTTLPLPLPDPSSPTPPLSTKESKDIRVTELECNAVTPVTLEVFGDTNETRKPLQTGLGESGESLGRPLASPLADKIMAEVSKLYAENISEITSPIADELRDFCENYQGQLEWISLAFGEALSLNKRNWRYIRAILEDWEQKGGPSGRAAQKLKRRAEGKAGETRGRVGGEPRERGSGAHQRDPLAGAREQGWEVLGGDESEGTAPGKTD